MTMTIAGMRSNARPTGALAALLLLALPTPGRAATSYEQAVLGALNAARADPRGYARGLQDYARLYQGRFVHHPGDPVLERTREGIAPVRETIAFLAARQAQPALRASDLLAVAAADHVRVQSADGTTGHDERGGIGPPERSRAHGGGSDITEVIAYGPRDPEDMVRHLFIDDGVADRGHRRVLVDPTLRFAGVACGSHPIYRTMCVIDLSPSWASGGVADAALWARTRAATFARRILNALNR